MSSKLAPLLTFVVLLTACRPVTQEEYTEPAVDFKADSIVLETAAHIPQEQLEGYDLVWSDAETDRAVYIKRDYTPTVNIQVGCECLLNDMTVTVTDIDEQGVYLSLGDNLAMHGISGSPITYQGVPFAFVSRATSVSDIYAVFY